MSIVCSAMWQERQKRVAKLNSVYKKKLLSNGMDLCEDHEEMGICVGCKFHEQTAIIDRG